MNLNILAPAAVLAFWSLTILFWMVMVRVPAMKKAGINLAEPLPGGRRGIDLEPLLPDSVNWKAHNYEHLHEQPTVFYVVLILLAISNDASTLDVQLAWAYTGLRIAHSVVHVTTNFVPVRFLLFLLSTLALLTLSFNCVLATI
tara:strand:- start:32 stop:463 length:432 start_codon:yes stop_codon:yes gene_type:complete